jgi:thiamine biosynthesis lipoprotein
MIALPRRRFLTITAAGIALGAAASGTAFANLAREVPLRRWRGVALGAAAEILLYHPDRAEADRLVRLSLAEVARLERVFSLYRADSALSALNRQGELRDPPFDLVRLLAESQRFGALTDGAFDVTVQPLWTLYAGHFRRPDADPQGPPAAAIAAALRLVGYRDIVVEPERIAFKRPGMAVTLNGIAQGYITDRVSELLQANGLEQVLVDLDEMRALGPRPDGTPWPVGIEDPRRPGRSIKTVELADRAMATSGGYGTQFDAAGRFNHIFDPGSGHCADRYLSVSVTAPLAATADALSTAFSTMRADRVRDAIAKLDSVRAIVIRNGGQIVAYGT